jgi:hypothetical protein
MPWSFGLSLLSFFRDSQPPRQKRAPRVSNPSQPAEEDVCETALFLCSFDWQQEQKPEDRVARLQMSLKVLQMGQLQVCVATMCSRWFQYSDSSPLPTQCHPVAAAGATCCS